MDHYSVLHISTSATVAEVRQAFKRMSLLTHPDKVGPDARPSPSFLQVKEAVTVLMDPVTRAEYDGKLLNRIVRTEGRVSSIYALDECHTELEDGERWIVVECRCGGEYRTVWKEGASCVFAECDSCSLVIQVNCA